MGRDSPVCQDSMVTRKIFSDFMPNIINKQKQSKKLFFLAKTLYIVMVVMSCVSNQTQPMTKHPSKRFQKMMKLWHKRVTLLPQRSRVPGSIQTLSYYPPGSPVSSHLPGGLAMINCP